MSPLLTQLFNIILDKACIPEVWCKGIILPIYKKKGDINDPDNYRGITILSCLGKLFTSILNKRINNFLENSGLLCEEQAGFRRSYSTVDHIFTLKMLIEFYLGKNKKLYCAFIDYRKAFDSVSRSCLWKKLLQHNIDGKVFKVIHEIYNKAKSCVKSAQGLSDFFISSTGVRQGENLSPILFSIFLNDLVLYISKEYSGLTTLTGSVNTLLSDDTIDVFFKLYLLLYADNAVIFAESPEQLQLALDAMLRYCNLWKLSVNTSKTKIVIFSRGKTRNLPEFSFNNFKLDIVEDFTYLGVQFNYNGKFNKNLKRQCDQARKAMYALITKSRKLCLDLDLQIQLFDSTVVPILLYSSEVCGCDNISIIKQFQVKYLKIVLRAKKTTPNVMLFGELGILPIEKVVESRILNFWCKIITGKHDKISFTIYQLMYQLFQHDIFKCNWLQYVKNSLEKLGYSNFWMDQVTPPPIMFKNIVKGRIKDQYIQEWNNLLSNTNRCLSYRLFKKVFEFEKYLTLLPRHLALALFHFRCCNHQFPIEKGRAYHIEHSLKTCNLCNKNQLGDEFHYIFECNFFINERKKYICQSLHRPNTYNFEKLLCSHDKSILLKLALFVKIIIQTVK